MANTAVVYGRQYDGKELRFEPSGGLMHSALVMQDRETDSYWSIVTGDSVAGDFKGTPLEELPAGVKMPWKDWVARHPDTVVLSVDGVEHVDSNPYDNYFGSGEGFRGLSAADSRLETKAPVFTFQHQGQAFAVPFGGFVDGGVFEVGEDKLLLYRPAGVSVFYSTLAFRSSEGFVQEEGVWREISSGASFNPALGAFQGGEVQRFGGFDTFWYIWSLAHPDTRILGTE